MVSKYLVILVLIFSFSSLCNAVESDNSNSIEMLKNQILILEHQLEDAKDFQSMILNTVYWALGGVFVLVGLIVGFGWFANFRVYERDKESIRNELSNEMRSLTNIFDSKFTEHQKEHTLNINNTFENYKKNWILKLIILRKNTIMK